MKIDWPTTRPALLIALGVIVPLVVWISFVEIFMT